MWAFVASAVVLLLAVAGIAWPLLFRPLEPIHAGDAPHDPGFSRKAAVLEALSELELEYAGGKLDEADYLRHKARYQQEYLALADEPEGGDAGDPTRPTEPPAG